MTGPISPRSAAPTSSAVPIVARMTLTARILVLIIRLTITIMITTIITSINNNHAQEPQELRVEPVAAGSPSRETLGHRVLCSQAQETLSSSCNKESEPAVLMPCPEQGAEMQKSCRLSHRCRTPTDFGSALYDENLTCRVSERFKSTSRNLTQRVGYLRIFILHNF